MICFAEFSGNLGDVLITAAGLGLIGGCLLLAFLVIRHGAHLKRVELPSGATSGGEADTVLWPKRWHCQVATLVCIALAIYGSIIPFEFKKPESTSLLLSLQKFYESEMTIDSRRDWVANVLVYIPLSFFWLASFQLHHTRRRLIWTIPLVILGCIILSVAIESSQVFLPARVAAKSDIFAQTTGAILGVVLWITVGATVVRWLSAHRYARPGRQLDWLLQAYLVGLLIYSVLPLDLSITPHELYDKYREGKITLIPFGDFVWSWPAVYIVIRDVFIFMPVGALTTTWQTPDDRPFRSLLPAVLSGGTIALLIETAQLFVNTRFMSSTDLLAAWTGVLLGSLLIRRPRTAELVSTNEGVRLACMWMVIATAYALVVTIIFCLPFEPIQDGVVLKSRYNSFFRAPFTAQFADSSVFYALSNVLRKLLLFAPLGVFLALAVNSIELRSATRRIALCAVIIGVGGLAFLIEMVQVMLPARVPDITDVALSAGGALVGLLVTTQFVRPRETGRQPAGTTR